MIINNKIYVRNYKCFDIEGAGFDRIMPVNIIIGKNNSGKSSLIDLIKQMVNPGDDFFSIGREGKNTEIVIDHRLSDNDISRVFKLNERSLNTHNFASNYEWGKKYIDKNLKYIVSGGKGRKNLGVDHPEADEAMGYFNTLVSNIQFPLANKTFFSITAERDIVPEDINVPVELYYNGTGATSVVQNVINSKNYNSNLIEKTLLHELNRIIKPDINFKRILVQIDSRNKWEIYFEDERDTRIALSSMGSGIKTILLVLLSLIVKPSIDGKSSNDYVYAFEELENNLHPSLQRRLYSYLIEYSNKYNVYLFLTTHSNVVIDAFGTYENAQLIHVINNREKSTTKTVLSYNENKHILKDLDVRASDILQSNGIIWVEGPSDRNYLNKWIEILAPELKEGLHYSIMFYGGRLLSNLTFDYDWFDKEIIPLLKINTNAFVIIDRDGKTTNAKLNETKKRIELEIGSNNCWITIGREIENYLSDLVVQNWLLNQGFKSKFTNDKNEKLEANILKVFKSKVPYNLNKNGNSSEIVKYIDEESMNVLDLRPRIENLISVIKEWNSL